MISNCSVVGEIFCLQKCWRISIDITRILFILLVVRVHIGRLVPVGGAAVSLTAVVGPPHKLVNLDVLAKKVHLYPLTHLFTIVTACPAASRGLKAMGKAQMCGAAVWLT